MDYSVVCLHHRLHYVHINARTHAKGLENDDDGDDDDDDDDDRDDNSC